MLQELLEEQLIELDEEWLHDELDEQLELDDDDGEDELEDDPNGNVTNHCI